MLDALNPDKVCFVIYKARELFGSTEPTDDSGSNASDDNFVSALTEKNDHPVRAELRAFLLALDQDESTELVALCWLGRGDFAKEDWADAMAASAERDGPRTADYLLEMELLGDYLEEGLAAFDLGCDDFDEREFGR
jgi:Protein of unknown function (DUF3775)